MYLAESVADNSTQKLRPTRARIAQQSGEGMSIQKEEHQVINLCCDTPEKSKQALKAIFNDQHTLECMEASLKNNDMGPNREKEKCGRMEALEAFSQNSAKFWDMINE